MNKHIDYTEVNLPGGIYIARTTVVAALLARTNKRMLVQSLAEQFPGVWTRVYLRTLPNYVLAVMLSQDDDAPSQAHAAQCATATLSLGRYGWQRSSDAGGVRGQTKMGMSLSDLVSICGDRR